MWRIRPQESVLFFTESSVKCTATNELSIIISITVFLGARPETSENYFHQFINFLDSFPSKCMNMISVLIKIFH